MPNLSFPYVLTAHVHVPKSDESMKRVMERLKAHAKQIFTSVNPMGNVRNVLRIHSALGSAIPVKMIFVCVVMSHQDHAIQLLATNVEMDVVCVAKILNAPKQFKIW